MLPFSSYHRHALHALFSTQFNPATNNHDKVVVTRKRQALIQSLASVSILTLFDPPVARWIYRALVNQGEQQQQEWVDKGRTTRGHVIP